MTDKSDVPSREDLAVCAHDLRSALTVIAGWTALLSRGGLDSQQRAEAAAGIEAAIMRADALVADVLAGKTRARTADERVELEKVVGQAAADARAAYGLDVTALVTGAPVVRGDALGLARAVENLLGNAAKYASDGPVTVSASLAGPFVVVEVADRGPGIPEAMRTKVLEPFARLERDSEKPGTGLGLTVVRSVIERHRGTVAIIARDGGGTIVRLELPVASD